MSQTISVATKLARSRCRGAILSALESEKIVLSLTVGAKGRFALETTSWPDYWREVAHDSSDVFKLVDNLHQTWRSYIRSGLAVGLRREYCFRYFLLLDFLLDEFTNDPRSPSKKAALNRALSFECFSIKEPGNESRIMAAGTSTLRNPSYLLCKLARPKAMDDPAYLPLITVAGKGSSNLFYHYRQHKLSIDSPISILLYLNASVPDRPKSFHLLNRIESLTGEGIDPRADERAARIAKGIIVPYLKKGIENHVVDDALDLELVDIGAGSGMLAAQVCQHTARFLNNKKIRPSIQVCLVDLSMALPERFFRGKELGKAVDCISAIGADYQRWFSTEPKFSPKAKLRIGLISRFFNNLSQFYIKAFPEKQILSDIHGGRRTDWKECLPSRCLASSGPGPNNLIINNPLPLAGVGKYFVQPSLSNYFHALHLCFQRGLEGQKAHIIPSNVYLPIRAFDPDCLITYDHESILGKLLEQCELLIIQDSDLHPDILKEHYKAFKFSGTAALDVTKRLGLKRHFSYVLLRSGNPFIDAFQGEKLW